MFADLLHLLSASPSAHDSTPDARIALAALLVRVARSDGDYAAAEIAHIDAILGARYGLSPAAAAKLRAQAEALEADAPDTVRFTHALKQAVPHVDRASVLEALWEVVLADGVRDAEEDGFMRLVANLLGINDRDNAFARQRVKNRRQ